MFLKVLYENACIIIECDKASCFKVDEECKKSNREMPHLTEDKYLFQNKGEGNWRQLTIEKGNTCEIYYIDHFNVYLLNNEGKTIDTL